MIARARTVNAILAHGRLSQPVQKSELRRGDRVVVATENSVYCINVLGDSTYSVWGGWFDRQGVSPVRLSISGCTWGGSVIKQDIVAACGLRLEFGNRVVTSRIQAIRVIRRKPTDDQRLRPADSHELLVACYGEDSSISILG